MCRPSNGEADTTMSDMDGMYGLWTLWLDKAARDHSIELIQGCGIDHNVITLQELQEPSFILEWKQCPRAIAKKPRTLMTWDQAVRCLDLSSGSDIA